VNGLDVVIEALASHHDRSSFSCGERDLDEWFRRRASQDERRDVARVFVAVDRTLGVVGFYSLSAYTLALDDLPEALAKKLPRYNAIPAALIGRLARDVRARHCGLGELLLADAVRRILHAAQSVAIFAIVVDAKDGPAVAFYTHFGFSRFPARPRRLFMLSSVAAAALERL
jgi:ribosomal protein S18 acetylase RimI-like enzyme